MARPAPGPTVRECLIHSQPASAYTGPRTSSCRRGGEATFVGRAEARPTGLRHPPRRRPCRPLRPHRVSPGPHATDARRRTALGGRRSGSTPFGERAVRLLAYRAPCTPSRTARTSSSEHAGGAPPRARARRRPTPRQFLTRAGRGSRRGPRPRAPRAGAPTRRQGGMRCVTVPRGCHLARASVRPCAFGRSGTSDAPTIQRTGSAGPAGIDGAAAYRPDDARVRRLILLHYGRGPVLARG